MKVTTKGQVTIPQHIRRFLGVAPHSEVDFKIDGEDVVLILRRNESEEGVEPESRFEALRGSKRGNLTTEEWMMATRDSSCS